MSILTIQPRVEIKINQLITACAGTPLDWDQARQIKAGMTEHEVTALMGDPCAVSSGNGMQRWVWSYSSAFSGLRVVSITIKDGKVVEAPNIPAAK